LHGYIAGPVLCGLEHPAGEAFGALSGQERWLNYTEGNILKFIDEMDQDDVIIKAGT